MSEQVDDQASAITKLGPVLVKGWDFTQMMTTTEVATLFCVDPRTVGRWRDDGVLVHINTPGGHARYSAQQVRQLLIDGYTPADPTQTRPRPAPLD